MSSKDSMTKEDTRLTIDAAAAEAIADAASQGCRDEARRLHGVDTTLGDRYAAAARGAVVAKLAELRLLGSGTPQ